MDFLFGKKKVSPEEQVRSDSLRDVVDAGSFAQNQIFESAHPRMTAFSPG